MENKINRIGTWIDKSNLLLILIMWSVVVYYSITQAMARSKYTVIIFTILVLVYIIDEFAQELRQRNHLDVFILLISGAIIATTGVYLILNFNVLIFERTGIAYHYEYMLALLFSLSMFYLIQRSFGWLFLSVIIVGTLYARFGNYVPGLLGHSGLSFTRILNVYVLNFQGFFGSISGIVAAWVTVFMLYAGLLRGYGAFDYIIRLAFKVSGYVKSGVAQSAVVSSILVGSINGGQTTNAAMTGSLTIPLMKESGLKSSTAAAIESVASSGGQIMPPVMGAAAFVMASILGINYFDVISFAVIPALIFYMSVALAVHYKAVGQNIELGNTSDTMESDLENISRLVFHLRTLKFGIPLLVLIFTLGYLRFSVPTAALITSATMVIAGILVPILEEILRQNNTSIRKMVSETVEGLHYGAIMFAPIVVISMAINAIIDVFNTTGVPGILALSIMDLSEGVLIIALLLAMLICLILGLGMPTVASYTLVALLVAPTIIQNFSIPDISVHFFVLYGAILSGLTPPIAIAVVITTSIADSDFWQTSFEALKIAAPLYILPFAFIYVPEIFRSDSIVVKVGFSAILLFGTLITTHGLNYYDWDLGSTILTYLVRFLTILLGIATMITPMWYVRVVAFLAGLFIIIGQYSHGDNLKLRAQLDKIT